MEGLDTLWDLSYYFSGPSGPSRRSHVRPSALHPQIHRHNVWPVAQETLSALPR